MYVRLITEGRAVSIELYDTLWVLLLVESKTIYITLYNVYIFNFFFTLDIFTNGNVTCSHFFMNVKKVRMNRDKHSTT